VCKCSFEGRNFDTKPVGYFVDHCATGLKGEDNREKDYTSPELLLQEETTRGWY